MKLNINGKIVEIEDSILSKAIEDKTESIEVKSELVIKTKEEHDSYTSNVKKEDRVIGVEIGRKEVLRGLGIEGEAVHKDVETAVKAAQDALSSAATKALENAKIEPDKKVKELQGDLKAIQAALADEKKANELNQSNFENYKKEEKIGSYLRDNLPKDLVLPAKDMIKLVKDDIKLNLDENGNIYGLGTDGQPLKDENRNLVTGDKIIASYFEKNVHYRKPLEGGAGGGDSTGGSSKKTLAEFTKEQTEAGVLPNSPKFIEAMQSQQEAGKLEK
jgi:ribosomal protein S13